MDEVGVVARLDAGENRVRGGDFEGVPAHVGDLERRVVGGEADHLAGDPAEPRGVPVLAAEARHQLLADADAEERDGVADRAGLDRLDEAGDRREAGAAVGEGADAGEDDAVGPEHDVGVGGDDDGGAVAGLGGHALEALLGRVQVAAGIVDDRGGHPERVPLVEGTPLPRGSGSTAVRSARATALKQASAMWWLLAPSRSVTLRVRPAFIAKAVKNSRTSSVSKLPIFGPGKRDLPDQERPAGEVEGGADQRLVHRQQARPVAADAGLVAEGLGEGAAERDADVLDGVVVVDVQIAGGAGLEVEERVAGELVEHVVEEADAGPVVVPAGAVEIEADRQGGLGGGAADFGAAHGRPPDADRAAYSRAGVRYQGISRAKLPEAH